MEKNRFWTFRGSFCWSPSSFKRRIKTSKMAFLSDLVVAVDAAVVVVAVVVVVVVVVFVVVVVGLLFARSASIQRTFDKGRYTKAQNIES